MSKIHALPLVVITFCVGMMVGAWAMVLHYRHQLDREANGETVSLLLLEVHTLELLRSGEITNAIEHLEYDLDWSLIGLTPFLKETPRSPLEQTFVMEIQKARGYRRKFPRKTSTQVDDEVASAFTLLDAQSGH
jgi:hypothetical protein